MYKEYKTDKGDVITIRQNSISINYIPYIITGEQQSIGEWEDYDTQNIDAFEITNLITDEKYYFELFRHIEITLPWSQAKTHYSYRLRPIKK